jgi:FKBP-type peptidyl-prolyl cis-trans isomerase FklB
MLKLRLILLLGFALVAGQAGADQPMVLDNQSVGEPPVAANPAKAVPAQAGAQQEPATQDNGAKREELLNSRRVSPREKAALLKAAAGDENKQEGENFLASNKAKSGVVTLADGIQYKVLRFGKGKKPVAGSRVTCRYKGTLIDGKVFDQTDSRRPALMNIDGFVPGLREAVMLMPTGSKWEIVVPPKLGFGAVGNRGVGPNAVLVYQMEILSVR